MLNPWWRRKRRTRGEESRRRTTFRYFPTVSGRPKQAWHRLSCAAWLFLLYPALLSRFLPPVSGSTCSFYSSTTLFSPLREPPGSSRSRPRHAFCSSPLEGCGSVAGSLLPPASHVATQPECLFGTRLRCCLADSPAVLLSFSLLMSPFTEPWDFLESHRGNGRELGFGISSGFQRFPEKAREKRFPTVEIV